MSTLRVFLQEFNDDSMPKTINKQDELRIYNDAKTFRQIHSSIHGLVTQGVLVR